LINGKNSYFFQNDNTIPIQIDNKTVNTLTVYDDQKQYQLAHHHYSEKTSNDWIKMSTGVWSIMDNGN